MRSQRCCASSRGGLGSAGGADEDLLAGRGGGVAVDLVGDSHHEGVSGDVDAGHDALQVLDVISDADRRKGGAVRVDRKSVVSGKSVSVRVDLGGRRIIKKKKKETNN